MYINNKYHEFIIVVRKNIQFGIFVDLTFYLSHFDDFFLSEKEIYL